MDQTYNHLLIDEVSDRYRNGFLGISIKFLDEKLTPKTHLYRLVNLEDDCSAKALFNVIKNSVLTSKTRKDNLVGLVINGAEVIAGERSGVAIRIAQEAPHLFWFQNDATTTYDLYTEIRRFYLTICNIQC